MKQKDKPAKKVIIRYKGKNNSSAERIKTESQQDLNKNLTRESRVKNTLQNSSNNFERYNDVATEENRRTLLPKKMNKNQINDTSLRKTLFIKNKEKEKLPGLKTQNQKKEKDKISSKGKKLVNFSQKEIGIKPQKSERNLKKAKKDELERELKLNKSVGNLQNDIFNKNDNTDSINKSINSEKDNTINIDIVENKQDNRNKKQVDNNEKIRLPSLKNYKKEEEIEIENPKEEILEKNSIKENDENQIQIIELKSDMFELKREEIKSENNNNNTENKKDNNTQLDNNNNINNTEIIINTQANKKVTFNNEKISPEKQVNRKGKAYLNFVQNIKKANKKKKDSKITNILKFEDPKTIKKVNLINKSNISSYKGINKNKDLRQTINNPLISNLREDILNSKKDDYGDQINSSKNILKDNKNNNNINFEKYSGLILLKFNEGEKMNEIKLEGEIEEINNLLNKEKIEINNKEIILVDKKEFERIKRENEKIQNEFLKLKEEYDKQRELLNYYESEKKIKEEPIVPSKKKKIIEEENNLIEEDNLKIKEIQDRINKYKEELKKGNTIDNGKNERMSCRIKFNKKENLALEQKVKELEKKKDNLKEENTKDNKEINNINNKKNLEIKQEPNPNKIEIKNEINKNDNINKNINTEKKDNNIITNKDNKEKIEKKDNKEKDKDKNKGYSKALDRFKKRFKKGNSVEVRTKKSDKINEIARQLENVMGKHQSSDIIDYNNSTEIIHEQNPLESLESQPVITNKTKKPQRPQL